MKLKQPYTTDMTDFSVQLVTEDEHVAVEIFGPVTGNEPQTLLKFFCNLLTLVLAHQRHIIFIFNNEFGLPDGKDAA